MSRLLIAIVAALMVGGSWIGPARAQGEAAPAAATGEAAPADTGAGDDSMRAQCEAELRSNDAWRAELRGQLVRSILENAPEPGDAQWRAELKRELASEVHTEDAQAMLTNKRHVVMAYAALWILVLVFAVFLWMRQRGLKAEIARLERDIAQATAND